MRDEAKVVTLKLVKQLSLKLSHLSCCLGNDDKVIHKCENDETSIVGKDTWVCLNWVEIQLSQSQWI
jgi:hypothetical protein